MKSKGSPMKGSLGKAPLTVGLVSVPFDDAAGDRTLRYELSGGTPTVRAFERDWNE